MKHKITISLPYIDPAPSPFVCAICHKERPGWSKQHAGKHPICHHHARPRGNPLNQNFDSYYDAFQIDAARIVIREIENVARKTNRPAHASF